MQILNRFSMFETYGIQSCHFFTIMDKTVVQKYEQRDLFFSHLNILLSYLLTELIVQEYAINEVFE